ncbi:MAG: hypothetical protein LBQ97_03730, partial [Fusobacteriaceae bacterium]|nr:hypothetical protein [Fusobacteriaceae bacterium]
MSYWLITKVSRNLSIDSPYPKKNIMRGPLRCCWPKALNKQLTTPRKYERGPPPRKKPANGRTNKVTSLPPCQLGRRGPGWHGHVQTQKLITHWVKTFVKIASGGGGAPRRHRVWRIPNGSHELSSG